MIKDKKVNAVLCVQTIVGTLKLRFQGQDKITKLWIAQIEHHDFDNM